MTSSSTMPRIEWVGPPSSATHGSDLWTDRLAQLTERPGEWARFSGFRSAGIYAMAQRLSAKFPDYEIVGKMVDGNVYIYARFVGVSK